MEPVPERTENVKSMKRASKRGNAKSFFFIVVLGHNREKVLIL